MLKKETIKQAKALLKRKYLGVANGKHIYSKPSYLGAPIALLADGRMVLLNASVENVTLCVPKDADAIVLNTYFLNDGNSRGRLGHYRGENPPQDPARQVHTSTILE